MRTFAGRSSVTSSPFSPDIDRYLERGDVELRRGGATFRIAAMWLNDNEFSELTARFVELLQPYLRRPATPDRTRRVLRTIVLPGAESHDLKET